MAEALQKHPEFEDKFPEWNLCYKLFDGRHSIVCVDPEIFWRHAVESGLPLDGDSSKTSIANVINQIATDQWSRRSLRTRWLNTPEIIASLLISFMFRKCPDFSAVKDQFGENIKNVDGKGNSLFSFIKNSFALDYFRYGKAIIKVESSKHAAATIADEIGANVRPYFSTISPLQMPDWEMADGNQITNYNWLRYEYDRVSNRARATEAPTVKKISKVYYKNGESVDVVVYEVDLKDKSQPNNNWIQTGAYPLKLSRIPFVVLEDVSWLKDVNQEALRYHNLRSSRDNILYSQGYQKVGVFGADANDPNQLMAMSETTWNIFTNPQGSMQSLEPPDLSAHEKALEESLNNQFKVGLNQLRILPSDSRVAQAADSLGEEKDNTEALIESTLEDIENGVNEAISLWAEYRGQKDYDGKITIEKNFSKDDIDKFLKVYNSMRDQFAKYEGLTKSATKKATRELGLPDEEQEAALKEIDKGPNVEVEEPLNDAAFR